MPVGELKIKVEFRRNCRGKIALVLLRIVSTRIFPAWIGLWPFQMCMRNTFVRFDGGKWQRLEEIDVAALK